MVPLHSCAGDTELAEPGSPGDAPQLSPKSLVRQSGRSLASTSLSTVKTESQDVDGISMRVLNGRVASRHQHRTVCKRKDAKRFTAKTARLDQLGQVSQQDGEPPSRRSHMDDKGHTWQVQSG